MVGDAYVNGRNCTVGGRRERCRGEREGGVRRALESPRGHALETNIDNFARENETSEHFLN